MSTIPARDTVLNLVLAALQKQIISSEDLRECTRFTGKDMSVEVRANAIALVENALQGGLIAVSDLQQAAKAAEGPGMPLPGYVPGGPIGYGGGMPPPGAGGFPGIPGGPPVGYGGFPVMGPGGPIMGPGGPIMGPGGPIMGPGGHLMGPGGPGMMGPGGPGLMGPGGPGMFGSNGQQAARPGDWLCLKCGNRNFSYRTECNINSCKTPKPAPPPPPAAQFNHYPIENAGRPQPPPPAGGQDQRQGDWTCPKCKNVNFEWRSECNGHGCDQKKEDL